MYEKQLRYSCQLPESNQPLMAKLLLILLIAPLTLLAQRQVKKTKNSALTYQAFIHGITEKVLSAHLHFIASDYFGGRKVGMDGERMTAYYLASQYKAMGIAPVRGSINSSLESYFQEFNFSVNNSSGKSQNVLAVLEGSDPQ